MSNGNDPDPNYDWDMFWLAVFVVLALIGFVALVVLVARALA